MDRLVKTALEQSPELVQKRLEVELAEARLREARGARLPKATFQAQAISMTPFIDPIVLRPGTYGELTIPDTSGYTSGTYIPPPNIEIFEGIPGRYMTTFVQLEQPLYTSGRVSLGIALSGLNKVMEDRLLSEKGFETSYMVRQIGLALLLGEASLSLLETMLSELKQIADDTLAIRQRGMLTDADVLEVQAGLSQLEEEQAKARAELVRVRESLRLLTGASTDDPFRLEGSLESLPVRTYPPAEQLLAEIDGRRPELKTRATQVDLARANVQFCRADLPLRPVVGLRVEGGFRGDRIPVVQTNWTMNWDHYYQAVVAVQVKVLDGGAASSKVQQARIQQRRAELGEAQTRALITAQVREQSARLEARRQGVTRADAEERSLREKRRKAELAQKAGTLGRAEFLREHLAWSRARANRLMALFNLQLGQLELEHAAGLLPRTAAEVDRLEPTAQRP